MLLIRHERSSHDEDLVLGVLPLEKQTIERARRLGIGGVSIPVCTPEDLIIMKALARRQRDVADIEALLDVHPALDLARMRYWVGQFAEALEASEILTDLERLLVARGKT